MRTDFSKALILLIDDDRLARKMLPEVLEGVGAEVVTAGNAEEALAYLEGHCPDLILCDAVMPATDGFQLCEKVKENPLTRDIPFAILTSLSRNVGERSIQAGADDFFLKKDDPILLRLRAKMLLEIALSGGQVASPLEAFAGDRVLMASLSAPLMIQLSLQLTPAGIQVESCPGAEAVRAKLEGPPPALLILDTKLEDGLLTDVTEDVRKHGTWTKVPILVLADKGDEPVLDSQETLVQDWITKPLDGREVRRRVLMMLRCSRAINHQAS